MLNMYGLARRYTNSNDNINNKKTMKDISKQNEFNYSLEREAASMA